MISSRPGHARLLRERFALHILIKFALRRQVFLVEASARVGDGLSARFDASNKMSISWMSSWSFAMGVGGGFVAREPGGERIVSLAGALCCLLV